MKLFEFESDSILNGVSNRKFITSVQFTGTSNVRLYISDCMGGIESYEESFRPFFLISDKDALIGWKGAHELVRLDGDNHFQHLGFVENWADLTSLRNFIKKTNSQLLNELIYIINDPVQQYLTQSGNTMFIGMQLNDVRRLQLDIETYSIGGFSNARRETDKIIIISLRDNTGWEKVIHGLPEDEIISEMISQIKERNPDIIEGHNIFNFDLPYIETRAKRYGIKLTLGRDDSPITHYPSRINIAEKTISYKKYEIAGRSIADTLTLARLYDVSTRSMESYGLKYLARYFGIAEEGRTYIDGDKISWYYDNDPDTLLKYAIEDVRETDGISRILSQSVFYQAKIFPFSYQNTTVKGNATKIDSLMLRSYLDKRHSIPKQPKAQPFSGGYTDILKEGIITGTILNCDVQSLYPSVMLLFEYFPANDSLGVFANSLNQLKKFRLKAKKLMLSSTENRELYDGLQSTFKILINSYYGYLGSSFGHFSDFNMAENITKKGREIIQKMVQWLQDKNAEVIEVDTDGIYFVPPAGVSSPKDEEVFIEKMSMDISPSLKIELAGRYKGMFSYKMKNYALLDYKNRLIIKGSGLRSRGLELFQRQFMEELFYLMLTRNTDKIPKLFEDYLANLKNHKWDIKMFLKRETLKESLKSYREKVTQGKRNQAAAYELAIAAERSYTPGDHIYYYATGDKKTIKLAENCKLAKEWDSSNPDENIPYYEKKLTSLYKKFEKYFTS